MRLFLAFDLDIKDELHKITKIFDIKGNIRWVKKDNFHLTVKYLGDESPKYVIERLDGICYEPFEAFIDRIGFFPSEKYLRVMWLGIKPEDYVISIQKEIDKSLMDKYKPNNDYVPHITLARINNISDPEGLIKKASLIHFGLRTTIKRLCLFNSTLTKDGPRYDIVHEF